MTAWPSTRPMPTDDDVPALADYAATATYTWQADALCREHPEVDFFPPRGGDYRAAIDVCRRCLVRDECLAHAIEHGEKFGVWGGVTERGRKGMRRRAREGLAEAG